MYVFAVATAGNPQVIICSCELFDSLLYGGISLSVPNKDTISKKKKEDGKKQ